MIRSILAMLLLAPATAAPAALYEFRDSFRPNSTDGTTDSYKAVPWQEAQRTLVAARLAIIQEKAIGVFHRASVDGPISVYRAELAGGSQAKGAYRLLTVGGAAFPYPGHDWLTRILAHELVHAADPNDRLTLDLEWNALVEPRITRARDALAKRGLTARDAAAMPLGDERTKVEAEIRSVSGLPSAYSAYSLEETMAEVASFMIDDTTGYVPPAELAAFLKARLFAPAAGAKAPADDAYRKGRLLAAQGRNKEAAAAFTESLRLSAGFIMAHKERGQARENAGDKAGAIGDYTEAISRWPRYGRLLPYLYFWRGALRSGAGDPAAGRADIRRAVELNPILKRDAEPYLK